MSPRQQPNSQLMRCNNQSLCTVAPNIRPKGAGLQTVAGNLDSSLGSALLASVTGHNLTIIPGP